jgi:hypothetical protein
MLALVHWMATVTNCCCLRSLRTTPCGVRCSPIPPASERGSSSGEGSPRAERELLAGSPLGASLNDRDTARSCCEPSRDLTPWSSGGFRPTGKGVTPADSRCWKTGERARCGRHSRYWMRELTTSPGGWTWPPRGFVSTQGIKRITITASYRHRLQTQGRGILRKHAPARQVGPHERRGGDFL